VAYLEDVGEVHHAATVLGLGVPPSTPPARCGVVPSLELEPEDEHAKASRGRSVDSHPSELCS
jgi:hypothetical protein